MFDVRFLKNPHWVPALRPQTGKDPAVAAYIRRQPTARAAIKKLSSLLRWMVPLYVAGREELPDGGDRLHRRPASLGLRRRGAEARAVGRQGRLDQACRIATW